MSVKEKIKEIFKPRLKLAKGTRFTSFLFIAVSLAISALVLLAANMYYNIDTGEVVVEEIQRVSRLIRATGGLIVGGTQTSTLPSGVGLEIATTSAVRLSGANQELRFTGGTSFYVGIKAPTSLSSNSTYTLPPSYPAASGYVLTSDTSGNLSWVAAGTGGIGDITTVGDCGSGDCFTVGGTTSTTLWFKSGSYYGALNVGSLTANATYTLPAVSAGTYYFILASSGLTANQIPYMTGAYTVGGSPSLTFDATNRILTVGSSSNTGQLRLYSNNANYVGFTATSSLGSTVTYYWPGPPTASGRVLMGDTAGNLWWQDLGAAGYGDISTVGDCASGDCFVYGGANGSTLWFKSGSYYGALNVGSLTANATYTLPAVSAGTYYFALTSGTLTANRIPIVSGSYTLGDSANLTWDSGNTALVVGASGTRGQLRLYSNNANYVAFAPTTSLASTVTYTWPTAPSGSGYVLTSDTSGNMSWAAAGTGGIGDITTVGDCTSGDCFTQTGGSGNNLWFITGGGGRIQLTGASTASNYTVTLPAANGTIALGTGGANQVAYWTGTNTLAGTSTLPTSMGGTGANSSAWNGMVRVVGGSWGAVQGTAGYAAYWSDANTVAAEQYLSVSRGGTGKGSWTQWGVLYADGSTSLNNVATSTTYAILTANNAAAPSWRTISDLVSVSNGLTANGTTQLSIKLGGTLTENTTIALAGYDMIFNLTGTGDFRIQNNGSDVFVVNDSGQILYKNSYPLAQTGKQVLREMVPIFGFDLPVKTATTSYVQISRTIVNYPLNPCESGASRVHKLVIRYGATASSTWQVATSSTGYTEVTVPSTGATSTGSVYTISTSIPTPSGSCTGWNQGTETDDWWVRMKLNGTGEIMIYQIFLAGYDQLP